MRGRHPSGPQLADEIEGSQQAQRRLKVMLETITGQKRISEACEELGIGEAQFYKLRRKMLEGALASLEPMAAGRRPAVEPKDDQGLTEMQEEIRELKIELRASQIREEIALLMPQLIKPPKEGGKKTAREMLSGGGKRGTPDKSKGSAS
jgi:transposase-like protein